MIEPLSDLPSHLRQRLVKALQTGQITAPYSVSSLRTILGASDANDEVSAALVKVEQMGVPGPAIAAWLISIDQVAARIPRPDLVWTGPEVPGINVRSTRRVFEEMLGSAKRSIWASTYAFFDGQRAFQLLAQRMDAIPELKVTLLLNIQRRRGDTTAADQLVRIFADRFWDSDWPGSSRPKIFYDPRALELTGLASVLHAKALVVDEESVLVTSANLTEAALDRNIELGLLVRDRALGLSVLSQFENLIEHGLLLRLPEN